MPQEKILIEQVTLIHSDEESDRRSGVLRLGSVSLNSSNGVVIPAPANKVEDSGLEIRKWRKKRNLTLAQLATDVGISEAYLSQLENNKRQGTVSTYQKIAKALDVHISTFI